MTGQNSIAYTLFKVPYHRNAFFLGISLTMLFIKKIVKLGCILVAIIIPGIILAGLAALFLVDSHHFKPQLVRIAEQKLGRQLVIDGDFSLQFYPSIAIKLNQTHLKNPNSFGQLQNNDFAYVNSVKLKIELLPLLKGKVQIEELELDGLKLNLIKMNPNQDNWSDLVTHFKKGPEEKDKNSEAHEDENGNLAKGQFKLNLNETIIHQAELYYDDKPANKNYQLKNLNFYTKKLAHNTPSEIKGDFIFVAGAINTKMAYTGQMKFNPKESQFELSPFTLKSTLFSKKLPDGQFVSDMSGSLKADWKNYLFKLQNLTLKFNDSVAKGSANLDFSQGLSARFNLGINILQIDKYLPDTHLILNNIETQGVFSNQLLNLSTLKASLYQGNFQGSSKIAFKQQNSYQINGKFNQIDIQAMLSTLKNINKISGTANATLNLSTAGKNGNELKRNLNGKIALAIHQGYLFGLDIEYYLNQAQRLAKKDLAEPPLPDNKKTPFDELTGSFIFQNGVISNQDLHGMAKFYDLTGAGIIDLVNEQIQYRLKAITLRTDGSKRKMPLAVLISGPLSAPKVKPDMETYIQTFAQDQIEKQLNKQLEKRFGITSNNGTTNDSNSSTDKKALQKELINKGLQKLFGR